MDNSKDEETSSVQVNMDVGNVKSDGGLGDGMEEVEKQFEQKIDLKKDEQGDNGEFKDENGGDGMEQDEQGMEQDEQGGDGMIEGTPFLYRHQGFSDSVFSVAVVSKNDVLTIAAGSQDEKTEIFDLNDFEIVEKSTRNVQHKDSVVQVKFNYDHTLCASASIDGFIHIVKVKDGKIVATLEGPDGELEWIEWHPRGNVIMGGASDATVWLWSMKGKCLNVFAGHADSVVSGCFTCDGKLIVTGSNDCSLKLWNPTTGEAIHTFEDKEMQSPILRIKAKPSDPNIVMAGDSDGKLFICHLGSKKVLHVLKAHSESIESIDYHEKLQFWISGSMDGTVKVWDEKNLSLRLTLKHDDGVTKLICSKLHPRVFTASIDQVIRVWDIRDGTLIDNLLGHEDTVLDFAVTTDETLLISCGDDHNVLLFPLP